MRLNIFADGMMLTEALKTHVQDQLAKLESIDEFMGNAHLDVTLRVNKQNHVAEAKVRVNKKDHFVKAVTADMYESIEEMSQDLKRQLCKSKEKATDHTHGPQPIVEVDESDASDWTDTQQ